MPVIVYVVWIVKQRDSWLGDGYFNKLHSSALNENFHPDTIKNDLNATGFYLSTAYKKDYWNYVILNSDGTYDHHFISTADTLVHTGTWQMLQVKESWWYDKGYILLRNWHSYGVESNYYLKTYGGDRIAEYYSDRIVLELQLSELTFKKCKNFDELVSKLHRSSPPQKFHKYLQDNVFDKLNK